MTNIHIVTADKYFKDFAINALKECELSISSSTSSKKAIEILHLERPKLFIIDLFLPEDNGIDLAKAIRGFDENAAIILSSRVSTRTIKELAYRIGADDILTYPYKEKTFVDTVTHRLRHLKIAEVQFN